MSAQLHFLRIVGSIWSLSLGFSADQAEALGLRWWLDSLWTQTGAVLRDESMMKTLQITLRRLLKETLAFVFPSSMRTHIHNKKIHLVLATLLTLHGLIQLRLDSHQPWARKVLHCCVDWLRIAILDTNLDQCALTSLLAFLRQSLEGGALPDEAAVYVLFNGSTMYVGKALLLRSGMSPGVPARIMEHMSAILRKSNQCFRSIRAVLLRQRPLASMGFIIAKRGRHDWIKAAEVLAIRTLRPNGNAGQCISSQRSRQKRKRPPPRFRRKGDASLWTSGQCPQRLVKTWSWRQARPQGAAAPWWTAMVFGQAYQRVQRQSFAKSGKIGPLNIYAPRMGGLLALWACVKDSVLSTGMLLKKSCPAKAVFRLADLVQMVQGYVRRTRGMAHVDRLLHRFRLPGRAMNVFKAPDLEILARAKKAVLSAARSAAKVHGPCLVPWIMRRSKFALSGEPKLCDRRNAVPLSKSIAISDVWNRGCFAIEGAMRGTEVRRLPGNWSVLDRDAKAASETKMAKDLSLWCKAMLMSRHASQACKRCSERSTCGHGPPPCPAEERAYIDDMLGNANEVILQDDKDRQRSWTMPAACLSAILMSLVLLDSSRWEITSPTKEQLSTMVYGVSLFALPAFLRRGPPGLHCYAPYCYPFVKKKCFSVDGGRTCKKKAHSCLRKVISFIHAPWRRAWRLAGRAIQVMITCTGQGFAVWRLKDVIPRLRADFQKLRPATIPGVCECCKGPMPPTSLLVADAAQMYEQINTDLVMAAFDAKAQRLKDLYGESSLTVRKARPVAGWPGGNPLTRSGKFAVFSLSRLRRILWASCALGFACLGDIVVRAKGLLIGGLLSMIAACCLLSHEEDKFLRREGPGGMLLPDGWDPPQALLSMRYVDDLLMISRALCFGCMRHLVDAIYSVSFDFNDPSDEQVWTDIIVRVDSASGHLSWSAKNPNREWVQGVAAKQKEKYPPYLARLQLKFGLLRGMLLGRAARLQELQLPTACQERALAEELQELVLEGYPPSLLRALVHSLPLNNPAFIKVREATRALDRSSK